MPSINPRNSGGPLVDMAVRSSDQLGDHESAVTADSARGGGGNDGVGFAIRSTWPRMWPTSLIKDGKSESCPDRGGIQLRPGVPRKLEPGIDPQDRCVG